VYLPVAVKDGGLVSCMVQTVTTAIPFTGCLLAGLDLKADVNLPINVRLGSDFVGCTGVIPALAGSVLGLLGIDLKVTVPVYAATIYPHEANSCRIDWARTPVTPITVDVLLGRSARTYTCGGSAPTPYPFILPLPGRLDQLLDLSSVLDLSRGLLGGYSGGLTGGCWLAGACAGRLHLAGAWVRCLHRSTPRSRPSPGRAAEVPGPVRRAAGGLLQGKLLGGLDLGQLLGQLLPNQLLADLDLGGLISSLSGGKLLDVDQAVGLLSGGLLGGGRGGCTGSRCTGSSSSDDGNGGRGGLLGINLLGVTDPLLNGGLLGGGLLSSNGSLLGLGGLLGGGLLGISSSSNSKNPAAPSPTAAQRTCNTCKVGRQIAGQLLHPLAARPAQHTLCSELPSSTAWAPHPAVAAPLPCRTPSATCPAPWASRCTAASATR
jgi:hypothetical protein